MNKPDTSAEAERRNGVIIASTYTEYPENLRIAGPPRINTSAEAETRNRPNRRTQRMRIHMAVAQALDGMTRDEIQCECSLDGNTVRPRVLELVALGMLHESAETRKTRAGRRARVLYAQQVLA